MVTRQFLIRSNSATFSKTRFGKKSAFKPLDLFSEIKSHYGFYKGEQIYIFLELCFRIFGKKHLIISRISASCFKTASIQSQGCQKGKATAIFQSQNSSNQGSHKFNKSGQIILLKSEKIKGSITLYKHLYITGNFDRKTPKNLQEIQSKINSRTHFVFDQELEENHLKSKNQQAAEIRASEVSSRFVQASKSIWGFKSEKP